MLAQNFKTSAELALSDAELSALITVMGMLERGEIAERHFDMSDFVQETGCGTVGCICGWAYLVSEKTVFADIVEKRSDDRPELNDLFYMFNTERSLSAARPRHAAFALRSFLSTGVANWDEAFA